MCVCSLDAGNLESTSTGFYCDVFCFDRRGEGFVVSIIYLLNIKHCGGWGKVTASHVCKLLQLTEKLNMDSGVLQDFFNLLLLLSISSCR